MINNFENRSVHMGVELFYDEALSTIYGRVKEFKTVVDFSKAIKSDPEACMLNLMSVEKRLCVYSQSGLDPNTIRPLELTDIEMEWYFIATVRNIKENDKEALPKGHITYEL